MKGNFMISESENLAPVRFEEEGKIALQLIYSNVGQIVEQHQKKSCQVKLKDADL